TDETLRRAIPETDVLIHCTPIGMHPKVEQSCVPAALLKSPLTVMDIVYNPLETQLLKDAKAAGCRTIRGMEMFLNQAIMQFELWTGQTAPADVMRIVLETRFS
ncbi:MAG: shikimate dehydrogenase family protein, partial [Nitrospiraceae bacterium]